MSLFSNGFKGNILTGLAIGIGASVLAPAIIPVLASIAKPVAKAALKGGVLMYEKGMESFAETKEVVEDLLAEVQSELAEAKAREAEIHAEAEMPSGADIHENKVESVNPVKASRKAHKS
jgi:hypothetical protein